MHTTSEVYRRLLRDPRHRKETRVSIEGTDYGEDALQIGRASCRERVYQLV